MGKKVILFLFFSVSTGLFSLDFNLVETADFNFYTLDDNTRIETVITDFNTLLENNLRLKNNEYKRNIYIFKNKADYNKYLSSIELEGRSDFIYIYYSNLEKNKLVLYLDHPEFDASLNYHLALQYIEHYATSAPEWYKKGIASYFEAPEEFNINKEKDTNWAIFYYLFKSENIKDKRILWDSLSYLRWSNDVSKKTIINNLFDENNIKAKATKYINEFETFDDKLKKGITYYNNKDYKKSLTVFNNLININNNKYTLHYYKGLCLSSLGNYNSAYSSFSMALDFGAPKDITYYSIAVNFYNSGDEKEAIKYLNKVSINSDIFNNASKLLKELHK